jgi:RND family efflux transporter MFP subunit
MKKSTAIGCMTVLLGLAAAAPSFTAATDVAASSAASASKGYQAITKPSKDVTVSFVRPGRIVEVLVAKEDEVKAGQLIARQDQDEELAALAQDKLAADSEIEIKAEEAIRDQKAKDVEKYQKFGSTFERENAILELKIEEAKIEVAKLHHEQAKLKYQQTSVMVEKLKLLSPISGVVADEFLKAGENAEGGNMKLVRIVQLDPLWVEVPVPTARARKLAKGDPATATFNIDGKDQDRVGKVAAVSPVGDAASETILVRLEVPNPEKTRAGDNVFVNFPPAPGVARP